MCLLCHTGKWCGSCWLDDSCALSIKTGLGWVFIKKKYIFSLKHIFFKFNLSLIKISTMSDHFVFILYSFPMPSRILFPFIQLAFLEAAAAADVQGGERLDG
jgi:hypothetical protein